MEDNANIPFHRDSNAAKIVHTKPALLAAAGKFESLSWNFVMNVFHTRGLFIPSVFGTALVLLSGIVDAAGPSLFGASVKTKATVVAAREEVTVRVASPDFNVLPTLASQTSDFKEGPAFTLDLFPDVQLDARVLRVEKTAGNGLAIIAGIDGSPFGSAVLVQNGRVMTGSITLPGGTYSITPAEAGTVRIAKINPSLMTPERDPRTVTGKAPTEQDRIAGDVPTDTGKLIDVIVFWTAAAQTAAGGAANIQNNIDTAITLTNTAYRNSGIAQRVRLVNKQQVNYSEATGDPFGDALDAITAGGVPTTVGASTVGAQRNAYGADEVVLVINDPSFCGLAWLPGTISSGNAGQGFAVVGGGSCLTTNFSFGHELGHNMGAHHDPYVAPGPGAFAYSHGISHIGASSGTSWRTIMAYNNQCAATVGGCTRLQYFSNPMVTYTDGFAMGDGLARNNALTLNKSANAVSNYRSTVVPISATFADVPLGHPSFGQIEFMTQGGYTTGCQTMPMLYCPGEYITRGQMAVFLERTKRGANFTRTATGTLFSDVGTGTPFAGFIEQLSIDGISNGCTAGSPPAFCPTANVNRAAMTKFLLKAKCGGAYTPATPGSSPFTDVPVGDPFLPWIYKAYTLGITTGCVASPLQFCPNNSVTREQMARFIYNTFPYGDPSDACTP